MHVADNSNHIFSISKSRQVSKTVLIGFGILMILINGNYILYEFEEVKNERGKLKQIS